MFGIASSLLWKIGAGSATVLALVLGFFLITTTMESHRIAGERDKLTASINDPNTGYIARLTQERTNVITLKSAIETQNSAYQKQSDSDKAKLAALTKQLAAAQARTADAEKRLKVFMATKPQGATLTDRVTDVDNRILKDLQK